MDMCTLMQKLRCKQAEVTSALFLDDSDFYLEIVMDMLRDPGFERLKKQIQEGKVSDAFDTAHMLKGIIANCGVTPLYELIIQIVEPLRTGNPNTKKLEEVCSEMLCLRDELQTELTE